LAAAGVAHAGLLGYESFGDGVNNTVFSTGYQSTTPGYSQGLSGSWTVVNSGNNSQMKQRTTSAGLNGAQANLATIGSSYTLQNSGNFNFLETGHNWGLEVANIGLAVPVDMTHNGTWYMSFVSSSGNFTTPPKLG
jgi:hypothetical protein